MKKNSIIFGMKMLVQKNQHPLIDFPHILRVKTKRIRKLPIVLSLTSNEVQLKTFPTLYALTPLEEVAKKWDEGRLLIVYLEKNDFTQLNYSEIDIKGKTKYVFSHPEIVTPFFNDLSNLLSFSQFGRQKRNRMGECLFNQGQVNFTLYKSI